MEFLAATNNKNKLAEIRRIMEAEGHTVLSLAEAGVEVSPEENGETFADNALLKAKAACALANMPTLGDDSGLEVDVLDGAPGVKSARFAGNNATDEENNRKLLRLLERMPYAARAAHFVCVVALVLPNGAGMEVEGRCDGTIGFAAVGDNGFGYDPLFYVNSRSFADRTDAEKDEISHRASALRRLCQELPQFLEQSGGAPPQAPPAPPMEP